jgi:autoinducer 2-degrading protein
MFIVLVHVHVKPDDVDAFKEATTENARNSLQEPGVARFDVIQQQDDQTRFILIEVYRNEGASAMHKETPHYARWRQAVEGMMAEARFSVKYANIYPDEQGW